MTISLIQQPAKLILSRQPVVFKIQSDSVGTPLRLEGSVTGFPGDSVQADTDKKAAFEFSDYLQGLISERGKTGSTPEVYASVPKQVSFTFREWPGDPPAEADSLLSGTFYLLDGWVPKSKRKALYTDYFTLLSYVQTTRILNWWPAGEPKKVLPGQKEFINFLQLQSTSAITVKLDVSLRFTDGSSASAGTVFTVPDVAYMCLVYFPTGYTDLGLPAILRNNYPTKTLLSYTVGVKHNTTAVSIQQIYLLDASFFPDARVLCLTNSFGLWELVLCTGQVEQTNEIKPEIAVTDGSLFPDKLAWKVTKNDVVTVNTGFLTKAQTQWLSDLLNTTEAYELNGSTLHPIVLKDISISTVHDRDFIFSAELQYEYAYNEITETGPLS